MICQVMSTISLDFYQYIYLPSVFSWLERRIPGMESGNLVKESNQASYRMK